MWRADSWRLLDVERASNLIQALSCKSKSDWKEAQSACWSVQVHNKQHPSPSPLASIWFWTTLSWPAHDSQSREHTFACLCWVWTVRDHLPERTSTIGAKTHYTHSRIVAKLFDVTQCSMLPHVNRQDFIWCRVLWPCSSRVAMVPMGLKRRDHIWMIYSLCDAPLMVMSAKPWLQCGCQILVRSCHSMRINMFLMLRDARCYITNIQGMLIWKRFSAPMVSRLQWHLRRERILDCCLQVIKRQSNVLATCSYRYPWAHAHHPDANALFQSFC